MLPSAMTKRAPLTGISSLEMGIIYNVPPSHGKVIPFLLCVAMPSDRRLVIVPPQCYERNLPFLPPSRL